MNVILCEDIDNLGDMGQKVKVAAGYARNYLIPRKLAVPIDSASARQIEHELRIIKRREEKRRAEMAQVAKQLDGVIVEFEMRAGEGDKLYGSVTTAQISEKLEALGYHISRKHLALPEPIKTLGTHTATVKMPGGITAQVNVRVLPLAVEETPAVDAEVAAAEASDAAFHAEEAEARIQEFE
ncbi:MAG: 50S ribosomal protein L9 [Candidatus Hydrogenedentes bacterium]|nr:50S ribosomal protein L9 [Candidatus Hydrogenedentota bacterium]